MVKTQKELKNSDLKLLAQKFHFTLAAMSLFPNEELLQNASLLLLCETFCIPDISQELSFDEIKCINLVMESLKFESNRWAVCFCFSLFYQNSYTKKLEFVLKPVYMQTLLDIIRNKVHYNLDDLSIDILLSTLGFLWSLSDGSPKRCEIFLEKGGLDLYLLVLNVGF